jgi:hypothetical protein
MAQAVQTCQEDRIYLQFLMVQAARWPHPARPGSGSLRNSTSVRARARRNPAPAAAQRSTPASTRANQLQAQVPGRCRPPDFAGLIDAIRRAPRPTIPSLPGSMTVPPPRMPASGAACSPSRARNLAGWPYLESRRVLWLASRCSTRTEAQCALCNSQQRPVQRLARGSRSRARRCSDLLTSSASSPATTLSQGSRRHKREALPSTSRPFNCSRCLGVRTLHRRSLRDPASRQDR